MARVIFEYSHIRKSCIFAGKSAGRIRLIERDLQKNLRAGHETAGRFGEYSAMESQGRPGRRRARTAVRIRARSDQLRNLPAVGMYGGLATSR